ncbi:MAG: bifunctional nuclease family protein [Planctomycetales bacterium]|nr:bifunctional nuclease family protein [bacterium]UNM09436.1 MAG: bifunctional nuclease family protein [Planctomycetales bacterium]
MSLTKVDFFDLRYDHRQKAPVLFLKDMEKELYLPIWIGELEASSIELAVDNKVPPRPLTHDLMSTILGQLGVHVSRVVIDRLESSTYYAKLYLDSDGRTLEVDCRPTDAIALALRKNVKIYVSEDLMCNIKFVELAPEQAEEEAADSTEQDIASEEQMELEASPETFKEFLRQISPSDFREN